MSDQFPSVMPPSSVGSTDLPSGSSMGSTSGSAEPDPILPPEPEPATPEGSTPPDTSTGTPSTTPDATPEDAHVSEQFIAVVTGVNDASTPVEEWRDTYDEAVNDGKLACVTLNARSFSVTKVFVNDDFVEPVVPEPEPPVDDTTTPTGTGQGGVIPGQPGTAEPPASMEPGQLTGSVTETVDGQVTGSFIGRV